MSRGFSDCCHYDEGYDDGYDDGKNDNADAGDVSAALRLLARERFAFGAEDEALSLERFADQIDDDPFFESKIAHEKERMAQQAALYAEARAS